VNVPPFHGHIGFNAHHSPMGAFFSFTCGCFGKRGGLGCQLGRPANQDLYIGVKDGDRHSASPLRVLPFYEGADKGMVELPDVAQQAAASYLAQAADHVDPDADRKTPRLTPYRADQMKRHYGWGSDTWATPDFTFVIYTPFGEIPEPGRADASDLRQALLPAVVAELTLDNTHGAQTRTGFFSLGFHEPGVRMLDEGLSPGSAGFALRRHAGAAGQVVRHDPNGPQWIEAPFPFFRWSPNDGIAERDNPVHLLGSCPGLGFEVPPGQKRTLQVALGCYLEGVVTTRLEGVYQYTKHYASLTDVLNQALEHFDRLKHEAIALDNDLLESGLSADRQFLLAHATRSYYGSTQLLEIGGRPWWIVNEGEYVMINTLDLSVDQLFWELRHNPWVVRNLLDNFVRYYAYHDKVKDPASGELFAGGISFCHDQGIHNQFSPIGRSSYELTHLPGCFSHMTQEQLCNWTLCAATYVAHSGDLDWLEQSQETVNACLKSMLQRDDPDPARRDGVMGFDSSRCGSGQEITTYDSLDHSLAQARNNLYLAVKCWATYLGLALMYQKLGFGRSRETALDQARRCARTIVKQAGPDGVIPAVFEKDNPGYQSRILPAVEGLVYPLYWSRCRHGGEAAAWTAGEFAPLVDALRRHTQVLLESNANFFKDGGIRLSSTSDNSWVSKIALFQHVSETLLGHATGFDKADAAHVKWETEGESAYWAMSDQIVNGVARGSKYYPRCVTSVLWLD